MLGISGHTQVDPLKKGEGLKPWLTFNCGELEQPNHSQVDHFSGLRFWYSGDVEAKLKEAIVLKIPGNKEKNN